jgi:tetratricopeptide (TPR) repeat protein
MGKVYTYLLLLITAVLVLSVPVSYAAEPFELFLAQGIERINAGNYIEALDLLKKALELKPDNPEVEFYLGIAYSRVGELSAAEKLFTKIMKNEEVAANVYLEMGRIYYAWDECNRSESYLTTFRNLSDDTAAREYANSLIKSCDENKEEEKLYRLYLSTGIQYDDNVVLEPTNPPVKADRDEDSRFVALITAGARVFKNSSVKARVDYNFYQSVHARLDKFNVHYHKISPSVELTVSDVVKPSAGYAFEYINFGGDEYGLIHTFFLKANVWESKWASIDGSYEFKYNDYKNTGEFRDNSDHKGDQHIFGLKQNFSVNMLKGNIHYNYDRNNADKDFWAYCGNNIGAELSYRIVKPLLVKLSADYSDRDYDDDFPGLSEVKTREDKMQQYGLNLLYAINNKMAVMLTENYTRNDSNLLEFDYHRNIIGILFTYSLM